MKNFEKVKKCMEQMPTFEKAVKNLHELKTKMDLNDRLTYPLLIWYVYVYVDKLNHMFYSDTLAITVTP